MDVDLNPSATFRAGEQATPMPPGPNGPVGSMWIALSRPIHGAPGTPEPALTDKTGSHGCIRLANWTLTHWPP